MAFILAERVFETSTTTGTGSLNLDGAQTGFQTFVAGIGGANTTAYLITDNTDWEVGIGTVTSASPDTLARDSVIASSAGGAKVNWGAGTRNVVCTNPAALFGSLVDEGAANGILVRTSARVYTPRSLVAGNAITLTNASAIAGNPTIAVTSATFTKIANNLSDVTASTARSNLAAAGTGVAQNFTAGQFGQITALTVLASAVSSNMDSSNNFLVSTVTVNITLTNPAKVNIGQEGSYFFVQPSPGGKTVSFGTSWKFKGGTAPSLSITSGAVDRLDYIAKSSTEIHGVLTADVK